MPGGIGRGLSARFQTEFGEDASDVMLGGARADEEPFCQIGVREARAEKLQDFELALTEQSVSSRSGSRAGSELT